VHGHAAQRPPQPATNVSPKPPLKRAPARCPSHPPWRSADTWLLTALVAGTGLRRDLPPGIAQPPPVRRQAPVAGDGLQPPVRSPSQSWASCAGWKVLGSRKSPTRLGESLKAAGNPALLPHPPSLRGGAADAAIQCHSLTAFPPHRQCAAQKLSIAKWADVVLRHL